MEERKPMASEEHQARAEASIIGSLLHNRALIADLGDVDEKHFVAPAHRQAWAAVSNDASIDDDLALQIAAPDLTDAQADVIMRSKHTRETVMRARALVFESRTRRELREALAKAMSDLDDNVLAPSAIATAAQQAITEISSPDTESQGADAVARALEQQEKSETISSGIPELDYVSYGGLHVGQLLGLFGRYKAGKTVMAATIASNLERRGIPTLMVSLERRKHDVERFLVSRAIGIDARDLDLRTDRQQTSAFGQYKEDTRSLRYVHHPAITIEQLRTQIRSTVRAHGTRVVLVDYWQLIVSKSKGSQQEKQQEAAQMLADLASELDISIVVMGQINQQGEPRGGEGILASAGIVVYIERPSMGDGGFLRAVVSNKGPVRQAGGPEDPSITLAQPGPHFRSAIEGS
jgi:replicative DNA helicase